MSNIQKAIEIERQYIDLRLSGLEPFPLFEEIEKLGFSSLEDYFENKRSYLFKQIDFNYVEEPMPNGVSEIFKMVKTNEPGILFVDWEDTFVVSGNEGLETLNKDYCEENDITIFPLHTGGGTIVGSKGDFSFGVCCPRDIVDDSDFILNHVRDILHRHTDLAVTVNRNDICVDGKKICGSANYAFKDVFMVIMHFSFNDWSNLISNICTTNKIGKNVSFVDFVAKDEFKQEVLEWLL